MTDCPNGEIRDLLPDLLHARLAPAERRAVEAHVAGCADCTEELALLTTMRSALRRGPAVNVATIVAAIPAHRAPVRRSMVGWRIAAAIVALAAGGTSVAVLQRDAVGTDRGLDGSLVAVTAPAVTPVDSPAAGAVPVAEPASSAAPRELALGSAVVGDLEDGELSALLADLQSIEVLPSADVEPGASVAPVLPTGTN